MSMECLTIGPQHTLTQNVVYALPPRTVYLTTKDAVQVSVDNSTFTTLAASTTGVLVSAGYIKCTSGDTIAYLKAS